ncbi:SEC-C motif protein [compost metagenome]
MHKLGRNSPCHCGSGIKYKRCCLGLNEANPVITSSAEQAVSSPTPSIEDLIQNELTWGNEQYQMVAQHLFNQTAGVYADQEIHTTIKLWNDYSTAEVPAIKKIDVVSAALEYCLCVKHGHSATQSYLADKYGVSASTLSQRVRKIMDWAE